jgi:hypothetical protein
MSYIDWKVGDKVVCTYDYDVASLRARGTYCARCSFPVRDGIYTLRRIGRIEGHVAILLAEIVNPIGDIRLGFNGESGFYAEHFRPVQTRKSDISIFTAMLRPIDAKLKETV